jgi:serine/threonine protein kinase
VLEFVPGKTLFDHVRAFETGLPLATARRYFRELAAALAACHRLDPPLMHGDLKPDNVLIDRSQTVRLVDFGWSRPIDRLAGYATDPGGCLAYCAPEVLLGRGLAASDLYSLGLIMYEVLCGDGPHLHIPPRRLGDEATHYYDHKLKLEFPPIATTYRGPAGDTELFAAVERCCRFHAHERYADAVGLLDALSSGERTRPDVSQNPPACAPGSPVTNWRDHAGCLLDAYDYRRCLEYLEANPQSDVCHAAYRAICLSKLGRWDDVIPCGADAFERAALPPAHRALLRAALLDAARRGGDEFAIAYYESRAATP